MYSNNEHNLRFCRLLFLFLLFFIIPKLGHAGDATKELLEAAKNGDISSVNDLIAQGTDVNAADLSGNTPLICAAKFNQSECVKLLLEKGAYINFQCIKGCSALMWSAENGNTDIVKVLIDNGATLNGMDIMEITSKISPFHT